MCLKIFARIILIQYLYNTYKEIYFYTFLSRSVSCDRFGSIDSLDIRQIGARDDNDI